MAHHKYPSPHVPPPAIDPLDRTRWPIEEWALVEDAYDGADLGTTESLFAVANGYLGLRGNLEEGRDVVSHGTFVNGFHETYPIRHAEDSYGLARVGQTIVNVPDPKTIKLYVDDEPLLVADADLEEYRRELDFREGLLRRTLLWHTASGKRLRITTQRLVSFTHRHLALMTMDIEMLTGNAPVTISSQIHNRQDGSDEYGVAHASEKVDDPRKAEGFDRRVLDPQHSSCEGGRLELGYRAHESGMTFAIAVEHELETECDHEVECASDDDFAGTVHRIDATEGSTIRLTKYATVHTSRGVPVRELFDRCARTMTRARSLGRDRIIAEQREWLDGFWAHSDVEVVDQPAVQQAVRWNIFQLAQAAARADRTGVPAKGLTGSGYGGHYFWDTEIYVVPFLAHTNPQAARNALSFRHRMLGAARERAAVMAQQGGLFPWRTINGEESSAFFAAGTAQYHIDADISYALVKYVNVTGDDDFLLDQGVDILVETARLWVDLGFWRTETDRQFHIHAVTGPDEYTTVVNDNLFTNVMARFNLRQAARAVRELRERHPEGFERALARLDLRLEEVGEWERAADAMCIPFDEQVGVHPQDAHFLEREVWDLERTPDSMRPLLLHYHSLVIYRFQVLKQADVVLALFLAGEEFTPAEKRADFEYYDPLTTGDSTLSAVVQSIIAAEVGYAEMALRYFYNALFVDLDDRHGNTADGVHVASTGGVWSALVSGFGGMRDMGEVLHYDPRLPREWRGLRWRSTWHGSCYEVALDADSITFTLLSGEEFEVDVRGERAVVRAEGTRVALAGQGDRIDGVLGPGPVVGGRRGDGSQITASVPRSIQIDGA